jgi:tetratricopeptide (TPR) repeat protein
LQYQPDKALNSFEAMERVRQSVDPTSEPWLLRSRENLAWCYIRLGRAVEAEEALRPLLQDRYSVNSIGVFDWAKVRMFYGFALAALGRYEEATRMTKAALKESEAKLGSDHYLTAATMWYLVYIYQQQGDWDMATQYARRAHEIVRDRFGEHALATVDALGTLGTVDLLSGRREQALDELNQAYQGLLQVSSAQDPRRQTVAFYLAAAYHAAGRDDDALPLLTRIEIDKLSFVEPGTAWPARVQGLRGQILLNQGYVAAARPLISNAISALVQAQAPEWQVTPLRQSLSTISEVSVAVPIRSR